MARDPLETLLRIRTLAVDEARRSLAECLQSEDALEMAVASIKAAITRETEVASGLASSDVEVEAFAAWLRRIRPEQHAAHLAHDQAEASTAQARAVLAVARAGVQAAEDLLEQQAVAKRAEAQRRSQIDLDEMAQRAGDRA